MFRLRLAVLLFFAFTVVSGTRAADQLVITVTHDLTLARPAETIAIPWTEVAKALPGALLQHLVVKDTRDQSLPYQVTNVAPQAKDPTDQGIAYGELLFQHDFAAGEKSATFTVEKLDAVAPPFPTKVFARYVAERLDDFAWENDKLAHRTYGPALAAPATPGSGKEVLVTSGLDVWCKRVTYPVVDRWYNKGHDHYHKDEGEGMDMYQVGSSRGCGGTGVWNGESLAVGRNYREWRIIANGPVRAIFELTYDAWDAHGMKVAEVKRFTIDAGHSFDQIESTFTVTGGSATELLIGLGLNKTPGDKSQDAKVELTPTAAQGSLAQWIVQKTNGQLGTAILVPPASFKGFAEDKFNDLILATARPGQPLRYFVGAGWSKAGEFTTPAAWHAYVAAEAARVASPIRVAFAVK
jgi:hypothetical protein